jgi:predicted transcriptional regulator
MDIAYHLGSATAADIHARLPDAPTYTTVRGLLRILVSKGHLLVETEGVRFVYRPSTPRGDAGKSMIAHVVRTFFDGSASEAMAAMLGSTDVRLTAAELRKLTEVVARARAREKSR